MKRLVLILSILFFIAVGEYTALARTKQYTDDLSLKLTALCEESFPLSKLEELEKEWHNRRKTMGLFLHERPLDEFERLLSEAKIRAGQNSSDTPFLLLEAAAAAGKIWENERPSLRNIL